MSLSKRLRFDIFKRDGFTCGYCGLKPPGVILEVDHILPVSGGGTDEEENLITSCFACNRGKADQPLERRPKPLMISVEDERDRLRQLQEYQEYLSERTKIRDEFFILISDAWVKLDGQDPNDVMLAGSEASAVRKFLKHLPPTEIIEAIQIADDKFSDKRDRWTEDYWSRNRLQYFCGICWRKIRRNEGEEIEEEKNVQ